MKCIIIIIICIHVYINILLYMYCIYIYIYTQHVTVNIYCLYTYNTYYYSVQKVCSLMSCYKKKYINLKTPFFFLMSFLCNVNVHLVKYVSLQALGVSWNTIAPDLAALIRSCMLTSNTHIALSRSLFICNQQHRKNKIASLNPQSSQL